VFYRSTAQKVLPIHRSIPAIRGTSNWTEWGATLTPPVPGGFASQKVLSFVQIAQEKHV
jgi:hypothetical protein